MIRINLLGQSRPKNKRAAASAAAVMEMGEVGSPKLKVLLVLVLAGSLNVMYWYRLDKEKQHIAAKMATAEQRNRELADVKARYPRTAAPGGELQAAGRCDRSAAGQPVRTGEPAQHHR